MDLSVMTAYDEQGSQPLMNGNATDGALVRAKISLIIAPNRRMARTLAVGREKRMKEWEYKIVDSKDVPSSGIFKRKDRAVVEAYLSNLGRQGWEVINLDFRELEGRLEFTGVAKREMTA